MTDTVPPDATSDPGFFSGRLMIDILTWDWNLRIAVSPASKRPKANGLDYGRDFTIHGQVRAPGERRGKRIRVILSPFGPKVRFGRGGLQQVGALNAPPVGSDVDFEAVLMLPEDAIASTATSLAATWRHLQIQGDDDDFRGGRIFAYAFHAHIPPNFEAWANAD